MSVAPSESSAPQLELVDEFLEPIDLKYKSTGSTSTNKRYSHDKDQSFVTLSELEKDKEDTDEKDMFDMVGLFQILYYKPKWKDTVKTIYNKKKGEVDASYERIMFLRCVLSPPGSNVFAIMMANQRNCKLFDLHLTVRDHQGFSPGTYVTVESPQVIENSMGNVPLFDTPSSFRIVDTSNLEFLPVKVSDTSARMSSFHFPKVKMQLLNFAVVDVPCKGSLCDGIDLYKDGNLARSCPCITGNTKGSRVITVVKLKVIPALDENGDGSPPFIVIDFTSHKFTRMFVKNGAKGIPSSVNSTTINSSVFRKYHKAVREAINAHEFSVTGWSRRGTITDQGSVANESVKNSTLNHHLVSVECIGTIPEESKVDLSNLSKDGTSRKKRKQRGGAAQDKRKQGDGASLEAAKQGEDAASKAAKQGEEAASKAAKQGDEAAAKGGNHVASEEDKEEEVEEVKHMDQDVNNSQSV